MWRLDNPLGCDRDVVRPAHPGTPEPLRECPAPKRTLRSGVFRLLKRGFSAGRFVARFQKFEPSGCFSRSSRRGAQPGKITPESYRPGGWHQ